MAIPEGWISYTATVRNKIGKQASKKVEDMIASYIATNPNAAGDELRSFAFNAIKSVLQTQGEAAGALARDNFATVMDSAGENVDTQLYGYSDVIDEDYMRGHIYKSYRNNFSDSTANVEQFIRAMGETASSCVNRMHMMNTKLNADANDKRYARVPTGSKTCAWCMMLASKGAMYYSEDTAKAGNHNNCDCVFVAMPKGKYVDGWDGKSWERMQGIMDMCEIDPYTQFNELTKEQSARLSALVNLYNMEFFKSGMIKDVEFFKPLSEMSNSEVRVVSAFYRAGMNVRTLKENPIAKGNIDNFIDRRIPIETKEILNAGSAINNRLAKARKNWYNLHVKTDLYVAFDIDSCKDSLETIEVTLRAKQRNREHFFIVKNAEIVKMI